MQEIFWKESQQIMPQELICTKILYLHILPPSPPGKYSHLSPGSNIKPLPDQQST